MLLHYLEKLKLQIFWKYSADMEENANKLHFECTDFNSSTRATVYAECICVLTEYLKYLSIRRHRYFLRWNVGEGTARSALPCRLSTVPVSRNTIQYSTKPICNAPISPSKKTKSEAQLFEQFINTTLCQLLSGNLSVNLFAMYPFKYKLYQSLVLVHHVYFWQEWRLLWRISGATNWSQK